MSDAQPNARLPVIWIVDDSPTEAAITKRSLGSNYVYEMFSDGSVLVERISGATQLPDVILLDWMMPGMTGDEVCRFLRARPETADLPIILVTASRVETADVVQGLRSGASDYVARPFAAEELRARVDAALRAKALADSTSRERDRLATVNQLARKLLRSHQAVDKILDDLAKLLTVTLCDGCSILLFPGPLPAVTVSRHRNDPSGSALAAIASVADPMIHGFANAQDARAKLPPAYGDYIDRFGLCGLAILPFSSRDPVRGVVTLTRDGGAGSFDADDIATIETCIEYASLAIESSVRFDAERIGREQLDTVLRQLPIGILATDAQGMLTLVNAAARELITGADTAVALSDVFRTAGWSAGDGSPIGDAEWVLGGSSQSRVEVSTELQLRSADGSAARVVSVSAVPLRDGSHKVVGSVNVVKDVSADRAIAAERDRIARYQEELMGIVGHDLRNPLGAILAGTEVLKLRAGANSAFEPVIRRIRSSTHRMTRIVDQLLDVTRARLGGGIPVSVSDTALKPLISGVVEELALAYPETKFELRSDGDIQGQWDPDRLGQVVANLLGNAAQYGRPGAPVGVEVARDNNAAIISIRNAIRDAPIAPEVIATMFQPYRRGNVAGHSGGLGLGLYIVHEIVRAHGGTIDVQSNDNGTVFRVMLPIRATESRMVRARS
ncbi:MAG: response regulator [Kofleriaceae bacterium]